MDEILEFSHYRDIPHLLMPLMSKMEQAMNALDWCVQETERRYQLLSLLRVRNIDGYNQKVCESNNQDSVLPRIVIVIDEFSDLMLKIGKKAETVLARLTQKSSIVGIHLILVTQHLSSSVITDAIKENIPTRIAFRVSNKTESNLILGKSGAEDLLEDGAMLINSSKKSDFNEIKGIFVSRKEEYRIQ
ncbi:MAG: FtsK/SpoIIIE domain-containing protein [Acinetobacter parvus]